MLEHHHILALGFLPGITSLALRRLVERIDSWNELKKATPEMLASLGLRRKTIEAIALSLDNCCSAADEQLQRAGEFGARIIHLYDDDYPAILREIYAPPVTLYVAGELSRGDEHAVAIVGTRSMTMYGRLAAEEYAGAFARAGVTVVSGLARGVDTSAHRESLKCGGRTIAVIASGLDSVQPYGAASLAHDIADHGAVISEYPFGTRAVPAYFPQRNRIISGLARGTVIIESDEKGGAMITAGFALDQNREVFAVPGNRTAPKSRGTNLLIRTDRARLTQSPKDVLDALGYHIPPPMTDASVLPDDLSLFEQKIYETLSRDPLHVDDICIAADLPSNEVLVGLLTLEFKGLVRQMAGQMYLREWGR